MVTLTNSGKIERVELSKDFILNTDGREVVVILLSGQMTVCDRHYKRENVFTNRHGNGFYVANCGSIKIKVTNRAEVCIVQYDSSSTVSLNTFNKETSMWRDVGEKNFKRTVHTLVDNKSGLKKLIIGETFKDCGMWSSWPPHKHDTIIEDRGVIPEGSLFIQV